jgi:hypothetical protein
LAGAVGVSEAFQILRGNVRAGRRDHGLSLWRPDLEWTDTAASGPSLQRLLVPNRLHVVGLGHLGQAYLWTLGWLPFPEPSAVELVLQDADILTRANLATSLLARSGDIGRRKTRVAADAIEALGLRTRLIEGRFTEFHHIDNDDPQIALVGVDNPFTRAALGNPGWKLIIDVGLGAGAGDYLDARLHSFPGGITPAALWGDRRGSFDETLLDQPAYRELERQLGDRCGVILIAGRAVGASFVGAAASSIAVAELMRYYADPERRHQVVDVSLRDLSRARIAAWPDWDGPENLGYIEL